MLDSPTAQSQTKRKRSAAATSADPELDFQWPLQEEEFFITLEVDSWNLGSVQSYNQELDTTIVQALITLKTCAKGDVEKTYWIYPTEKVVDHFEKKHVLEIRPSVTLAKNIKRKDLVFALLNREVIEALWGQLINPDIPEQQHNGDNSFLKFHAQSDV